MVILPQSNRKVKVVMCMAKDIQQRYAAVNISGASIFAKTKTPE
ncbi:MAG TPA: hypothetical protein VMW23_10835 [Sedimentisphaerales bacterium]|nr:hypothetical protein [Sedimentisphaerales bacterium]